MWGGTLIGGPPHAVALDENFSMRMRRTTE
jgi:hypothetical protein